MSETPIDPFAARPEPTDDDRKHHELAAWFDELPTSELECLRIELIGEEAHREASEEA